eukprot:1085497-Prorocentrum_minimum.AAC.2
MFRCFALGVFVALQPPPGASGVGILGFPALLNAKVPPPLPIYKRGTVQVDTSGYVDSTTLYS